MPGLGRIPEVKPQQQNFLIREAIDRELAVVPESEWPRKRYWDSVVNLDQGNTGTCVGHGFAHRAEDGPIKRPDQDVDPFEIYRLATHLDPWPDNDDDLQAGTSVDAGARASMQLGYVRAFYWAWDIHTAEEFVLNHGSLVIGIPWYDGMFRPVQREVAPGAWRWVIEPSGGIAGGHCLLVNGRNRDLDTWRMKNSWGTSWGQMGQVSITTQNLERLLSEDGEFCWPQEIRP